MTSGETYDAFLPPDSGVVWDAGAAADAAADAASQGTDARVDTSDATGLPADAGATTDADAGDAEGLVDAAADGGLDASADADAEPPAPPPPYRVACLTGFGGDGAGSNRYFRELCETLWLRGQLVEDCTTGTCRPTFDNVSSLTRNLRTVIWAEIFDALDTNEDGSLDDFDDEVRLVLLGFSWGGVNLGSLSRIIRDDARVAPSRKTIVDAIALDPYQPGLVVSSFEIPANVQRYTSFLRSVAPSTDCSRGAAQLVGGPYIGRIPMVCSAATCEVYDFSMAASRVFDGQGSAAYRGDAVGHCLVPDVAAQYVLAMLQDAPPPAPLPPRVL